MAWTFAQSHVLACKILRGVASAHDFCRPVLIPVASGYPFQVRTGFAAGDSLPSPCGTLCFALWMLWYSTRVHKEVQASMTQGSCITLFPAASELLLEIV